MEFSKYIVPIFADDGFRGNGFIVNGYLVMPYHLLKINPNSREIYSSFEYLYNNEVQGLDTKTSIIDEGYEKDVAENPDYARDLLIFRINIDNSDIALSLDYSEKEKCVYYGYNEDERGTLKKEILTMGQIHQHRPLVQIDNHPVELKNCMTCKVKLKPGNSGGLVCQDNNIIGMFIRDHSFPSGAYQSMFLKASYIAQAIDERTGSVFRKK